MATSTLPKHEQMDYNGLALLASEIVVDRVIADNMEASGPVTLSSYDVAGVPDATDFEGAVIFVTDGAEGSPTIAWSDGTNWIEEDGTAIDAGA
jgi:hypothetical protein